MYVRALKHFVSANETACVFLFSLFEWYDIQCIDVQIRALKNFYSAQKKQNKEGQSSQYTTTSVQHILNLLRSCRREQSNLNGNSQFEAEVQ